MTSSLSPKTLLKRLLWACGWDVRRRRFANTEEQTLIRLLASSTPSAVLDVGANFGQFGLTMRAVGYRGRIVSFEALPHVHERLRQQAAKDRDWHVAPCAALGSHSGTVNMNVSANTVSSSILPMKTLHSDAVPQSSYVGAQSVRLERLDVLARDLVPAQGELYLKLDTQGYEKEVLAGATALLGRVAAIQIELSVVPLYEQAPTYLEMFTWLLGQGFELFDLVPVFRDPRTGRVLQMDGFFVRRTGTSEQTHAALDR